MNADREGHIDLPLLLIDDEADNASINTRSNPNETTAINKAIRDLAGAVQKVQLRRVHRHAVRQHLHRPYVDRRDARR